MDNASSDGTREFLTSIESDSIRNIPLDENTGFARANNLASEHARGQWLFLLNNDATCASGTLRALEESAWSYPEFRIFACHMIRTADGKIDNLGIQFSRCLRGTQIGSGAAAGGAEPREVFGASGGAMLVHRPIIDDIGLFDPDFFAYQEDVDFAVRSRLAGYRCLYLPDAVIHHKGGGTSSSNPSLYRYFNQRNMELVLRNIPVRLRWKYGLWHFAYAGYQVLKWSLKGDGYTVLKAKVDALRASRPSRLHSRPVRVELREFERHLANDFPSQVLKMASGLRGVTRD